MFMGGINNETVGGLLLLLLPALYCLFGSIWDNHNDLPSGKTWFAGKSDNPLIRFYENM